MGKFQTSLATMGNVINPQRPWWEVTLITGKKVSEHGIVVRDGIRPIDWTLDLISTGDINKVKEIWLHFPKELYHHTRIEKGSPIHQRIDGKIGSAVIPVKERGCVFQMKIKTLDRFMGQSADTFECQIIGAVGDKETGLCHCYIWDRVMGLIAYKTSIYDFGTWRDGIAPLHNISHSVVGLNLA
jgi:hypothetical protein